MLKVLGVGTGEEGLNLCLRVKDALFFCFVLFCFVLFCFVLVLFPFQQVLALKPCEVFQFSLGFFLFWNCQILLSDTSLNLN